MLPLYNSINSVSPTDGSYEIFTTCVEGKCNDTSWNSPRGWETFTYPSSDNWDKLSDEKREYYESNRGPYYCYDKTILDSCSFNENADNYKAYLKGDRQFCSEFTETTQTFFKENTAFENGCVESGLETGYKFDVKKCQCLDQYYLPSWEFYDKHASLSTEGSADSLRAPFYWRHDTFGEYNTGSDFVKQHTIFKSVKDAWCMDKYGFASVEKDTLAGDKLKWAEEFNDPEFDDDRFTTAADYEAYKVRDTILDPTSTNAKTLMLYVTKLNSPEIMAKTCDANAVIIAVPQEDTDERISGISTCYYIMLIVTVLSVFMALFLFKIDGKAEAVFNEEEEKRTGVKVSNQAEKFSFQGLVDAIKKIPVTVWILYVMCICFYVGVFTFVTQAPMFFERHSGLSAQASGFCVSLVYNLAVPCNPLMGAIIAKFRHEQGFLTAAYLLAGLAHFIMLTFKNVLAAFGGMTMLGVAYAMIGTTMWP